MEQEIMDGIIETIKERKRSMGRQVYTLDRQHDFLIGAMKMYFLLNPDSEKDGSWCPPEWMFGIMRGRDFTIGGRES